jgi:hypothetical protein
MMLRWQLRHFEGIKQSVRKHASFILGSVLLRGTEAALLHLLFEGQEDYPDYRLLGCVAVLCVLVSRKILSTSSGHKMETACSCKMLAPVSQTTWCLNSKDL